MDFLKPVKQGEIEHNARIKEYPTHYEVCVASRDFFRDSGYEEHGWERPPRQQRAGRDLTAAEQQEVREKAQRRARSAVRDIAACSEFTHFATLTLDSEKIERYEYREIIKRINRWLSNMVQRRELAYVLIPELHKDGALHFHGLLRGDLTLVLSGKRSKRGALYNLVDWKFGFSSVEELDENYERAVNYICKYITKGSVKVGGRWYLSGGAIQKPAVSFASFEWRDVDAPAYAPEGAGVAFKYFRVEK